MMRTKKLLAILLTLALVFVLAACGGGGTSENTESSNNGGDASAAPKVKIVMAHGLAETNPSHIIMVDFTSYLDENSDEFEVEIYPLGQLGNEREMIESCQDGSIQVVACSTSPFTGFTKDSGIFNIPWAIHSFEELDSVLTDEDFINAFNASFEKIGLKVSIFFNCAFRALESKKPVRHIEDFQGLNMRVMEIETHIETFKALGCMTTAIPFAELYTALQQGLVDAHDSNFSLTLSNNLQENTQYLTNIYHLPGVVPYTMNLGWYNGLTAQQQKSVDDAWQYALSQSPNMNDYEVECRDQMIAENGCEYFEFTPEDIEKGEELVQPAWEIVKSEVSPELYDAYFKAIEKART
jgi:TRAP-type C4-dicarboxylate transport system substrate-binding protein